ncbi:putative pyruvate dehydrogenase (acetyl-transferring) [Helianthus anomalus]
MTLTRRSCSLLKPLSASFLPSRPFSTENITTITVENSILLIGQNYEPPLRSVDRLLDPATTAKLRIDRL